MKYKKKNITLAEALEQDVNIKTLSNADLELLQNQADKEVK